MKEIKLRVLGITCSGCADSIMSAMAEIGASADVDLATAHVTVRYAEEQKSGFGLETIVEAIEEKFRLKAKPITILVMDND